MSPAITLLLSMWAACPILRLHLLLFDMPIPGPCWHIPVWSGYHHDVLHGQMGLPMRHKPHCYGLHAAVAFACDTLVWLDTLLELIGGPPVPDASLGDANLNWTSLG